MSVRCAVAAGSGLNYPPQRDASTGMHPERLLGSFSGMAANFSTKLADRLAVAVEAAHHEGGILPAETETCGNGRPHALFTRDIRHVVQVTLRIRMRLINGGGQDSFVQA